MNTTRLAVRLWALGERLHGTVRRFFDSPLGPDAKPLEIRAGRARPPERPGHGMRFSAETLGPYRTGAKEVQLR